MIMQSINMAIKAILANKMRTFLTMLGIIIGVMALVVLVSLVTSATRSVTDEINNMGTDMFSVTVFDDKGKSIKQTDIDKIKENDNIGLVSPVISINGTAKKERESLSVTAEGTDNSYFSIQLNELLCGRPLKQPDLDNASYVVVLTYNAAEELFGSPDIIGKKMHLNGIGFEVVGVLEEDNSMMSDMTDSYTVYIPLTVAERMSDSGSDISSFYATASDSESMNGAEDFLNDYMNARFDHDEDAYIVFNQNTIADTMDQITGIFSALLGGIAAISLLVGGIGIMNIMLVSVTERTKEIGIRKAIGAKRRSILLQFLIEALSICLLGCVVGILISVGILKTINIFTTSMTFAISGTVIIVAVAFSTVIGLIFGVYPARKAAGMNPIDALRYE